MIRLNLAVVAVLVLAPLGAGAEPVRILSLAFEGNKILDSQRLKQQIRMSREGAWYTPDTFKVDLQNLERFCQDEGFLSVRIGPPQVEIQSVQGKGQMAALRVPIVEGPRYILGELVVKNTEVIKPAALLRLAPVRPGQPYSRSKIADWKGRVEESYYSMGYIRFQSELREEVHEFRRVVDCVLEANEGNPYRVGKISNVGDESINPAQFKKQLLVAEGAVYNPEMLSYTIQFLNSLRIYRPISEADVEIRIDDSKSTVDLTFRIIPLRKSSSS